MANVINKFSYIQIGQAPPKGSRYKVDKIGPEALTGWFNYTTGDEKEVRHGQFVSAQNEHGLLGYTSRTGASNETYTSTGILDSDSKKFEFTKLINQHFKEEGDICWKPVVSLEDYDVSFSYRLFSHEDYAAIMDKIMPKFFKRLDFEEDNMIWWFNHHTDTDNPHIHLSFLEKEKTRDHGYLSPKYLHVLKGMFYDEVTGRANYLEETGKSAVDVFQLKDDLKSKIISNIPSYLSSSTSDDFISSLQDLYKKLPGTGRLQYGSSHMIPYREELDQLVEQFLSLDEMKEEYHDFKLLVTSFDKVKSKKMGSSYNNVFNQEDSKLRKQIANQFLQYFKINMDDFQNNNEEVHLKEDVAFIHKDKDNAIPETVTPENVDTPSNVFTLPDENELNYTIEHNMNLNEFIQSTDIHLPCETQDFKKIFISEKLLDLINKDYARVKIPGKKQDGYLHIECDHIYRQEDKKYFVATIYANEFLEVMDELGNGIDYEYEHEGILYKSAFFTMDNINHRFNEVLSKQELHKKQKDKLLKDATLSAEHDETSSDNSNSSQRRYTRTNPINVEPIEHEELLDVFDTSTMFDKPLNHSGDGSKFLFIGTSLLHKIQPETNEVLVKIPGNWNTAVSFPINQVQRLGNQALIVEVLPQDDLELSVIQKANTKFGLDGKVAIDDKDGRTLKSLNQEFLCKTYFDFEEMYDKLKEQHIERLNNQEAMRQLRQSEFLNRLDYEGQTTRAKRLSLAFMREVEHEVEKGQAEYYGRYNIYG